MSAGVPENGLLASYYLSLTIGRTHLMNGSHKHVTKTAASFSTHIVR